MSNFAVTTGLSRRRPWIAVALLAGVAASAQAETREEENADEILLQIQAEPAAHSGYYLETPMLPVAATAYPETDRDNQALTEIRRVCLGYLMGLSGVDAEVAADGANRAQADQCQDLVTAP